MISVSTNTAIDLNRSHGRGLKGAARLFFVAKSVCDEKRRFSPEKIPGFSNSTKHKYLKILARAGWIKYHGDGLYYLAGYRRITAMYLPERRKTCAEIVIPEAALASHKAWCDFLAACAVHAAWRAAMTIRSDRRNAGLNTSRKKARERMFRLGDPDYALVPVSRSFGGRVLGMSQESFARRRRRISAYARVCANTEQLPACWQFLSRDQFAGRRAEWAENGGSGGFPIQKGMDAVMLLPHTVDCSGSITFKRRRL